MLGTDNRYYYRDDFMFFEFKGIPSEKYNLFLINEGDNLLFPASTNATVNYTSPDYQTQTYFLGVKQDQKTFSWNCAAERITLRQVQEISKWLMPGQQGALRYENNPFWCYDVVVDSLSDFTKWVQADGTYIITFSLVFKTIGANSSRGYWQGSFLFDKGLIDSGDDTLFQERLDIAAPNEYGIPEVCIGGKELDSKGTYLDMYVFDVGNRFLTLSWDITYYFDKTNTLQSNQKISFVDPETELKPTTLWQYDFTKMVKGSKYTLSYDSMTGLFLGDNNFVEDNDYFTNISENSGAKTLLIDSYAPVKLEIISCNTDSNRKTHSLTIKATTEVLDLINTGKKLFISLAEFLEKQRYNIGEYSIDNGQLYPINPDVNCVVLLKPVDVTEEDTITLVPLTESSYFGNQIISSMFSGNITYPTYLGVYNHFYYYDSMLADEVISDYEMTVKVNKYNTL